MCAVTWETRNALPVATRYLGLAAISSKLYGAGGYFHPQAAAATVELFDPNAPAPTTIAPTPVPTTIPPTSVPTPIPTLLEDVCQLPSSFPFGVEPDVSRGCVAGAHLEPADRCKLRCQAEFELKEGSTVVYECTDDKKLLRATIECLSLESSACRLPRFADGLIGDDGCDSAGLLGYRKSCGVRCKDGYADDGGSTRYACLHEPGKLSTTASLRCAPIVRAVKTCTMPYMGFGIEGDCQPGMALGQGKSCSVQCKAGFSAVGSGDSYKCEVCSIRGLIGCAPNHWHWFPCISVANNAEAGPPAHKKDPRLPCLPKKKELAVDGCHFIIC